MITNERKGVDYMSLKAGDIDEPHILSWGRIITSVTLLTMLLSGFMYQQTTGIVEAEPLQISQEIETTISAGELDQKTETESDKRDEIVRAISACRSSLEKDDVVALANIIQKESEKHNYDWQLVLAIIRTESQFDTRARSNKDARGLMQVLPSTAKWLSLKLGLEYTGHDSLYDPEYNIKLGTHYLSMLHKRYGNMDKAIAAYNRGPNGLTLYLRQGRKFPPEYLVRVMDYYKELKDAPEQYAS